MGWQGVTLLSLEGAVDQLDGCLLHAYYYRSNISMTHFYHTQAGPLQKSRLGIFFTKLDGVIRAILSFEEKEILLNKTQSNLSLLC